MKLTIRPMTFETNSSSTHSLVMMSTDEYYQWKRGGGIYSFDTDRVMSAEEAATYYKDYVKFVDGQWVPVAEGMDNWRAKALADSLNEDSASDWNGYGRVYVEDEGELNGVHGVCFYRGDDW